MLGYSPEEVVNDFSMFIRLLHREDKDSILAQQSARFSGESERYEPECRMRHADGTWRWIQTRGRVVAWDEDGRPRRNNSTDERWRLVYAEIWPSWPLPSRRTVI
jgi:two-component system sensor histidine kinase/response regulator